MSEGDVSTARPQDHEDELFARFQRSRDPALLARVYDALAGELLGVALHLARCPAAAEDLLQATFLAAIEGADGYDPGRPLRPWLLGILANQARLGRWYAAREPASEALARPAVLTPEEEAAAAELDESLGRALLELPADVRPVVTLRLRHGLSAAEIAGALERPPSTVRAQLARGLERLRRSLPAGLAGAAIALTSRPARGLDAVREAILSQVAPAEAAASLLAPLVPLTGVMLMKSAVAAVALAGVAAAGWLAWSPSVPEAAAPEVPAPVAAAETRLAQPEPAPLAALERVEQATPAAAAPETPAPTAQELATGTLVVVALQPGGAPADGECLVVEAFGRPAPFPDRYDARTGDDGRAVLEDLPAGHVYVRLLRGREDGVQVPAGGTAELTLRLWEGVTLEGEVVDGGGRAVPGAQVWLSERWNTRSGYVVARADGAGRFRLASVTPDHRVAARGPGTATSRLYPVVGEPGEVVPLRIVLETPGAGVRGRVLDPEGRAVPGATVQVGMEKVLADLRLADGSLAFVAPPERVRTDDDGRFEAQGLPLGSVPVEVRAAGFAPWRGQVEVAAGSGGELEARLVPEARVLGRVVDERGEPLAAVRVHTDPVDRFASRSAYVGTDGAFVLAGLGEGRVTLMAELTGYDPATTTLELAAGARARWDVTLVHAPVIHGTLTDARGQPLERWTVVALPEGDPGRRLRSQPTDADGRFQVEAVAGVEHRVWAQGPGGWRRFPRAVVEGVVPGAAPLAIRVGEAGPTTATLTGVVVDPDGAPVPDAELQVWHAEQRLFRSFPVEAATGRLEVDEVPPGTLSLELRSPAHPWLPLGERRVEAGELLQLGALAFPPAGRVTGTLEGAPDGLLDTLRLVLTVADRRQEAGVVTREGRRFRSGPLRPGRYHLSVSGDRVQREELDVTVRAGAESELSVSLRPAALRRVVFEPPSGEPPPASMWCSLVDGGGQRVWLLPVLRPDDEGRLVASVSAAPGHYRLVGEAEGGLHVDAPLELGGLDEELPVARVPLGREDGR